MVAIASARFATGGLLASREHLLVLCMLRTECRAPRLITPMSSVTRPDHDSFIKTIIYFFISSPSWAYELLMR